MLSNIQGMGWVVRNYQRGKSDVQNKNNCSLYLRLHLDFTEVHAIGLTAAVCLSSPVVI
jgi:hypothetical protein